METVTTTLDPASQQLGEQLVQALRTGSWYVVAALAVMLAVRLWRTEAVQTKLPRLLQWDAWTMPTRLVFVFASSVVAAALLGVGQGIGWRAALAAGLVQGLSMLFHKSTQAVGGAATRDALANDPAYEPGAMREALSIVVPIVPRLPPVHRVTPRIPSRD